MQGKDKLPCRDLRSLPNVAGRLEIEGSFPLIFLRSRTLLDILLTFDFGTNPSLWSYLPISYPLPLLVLCFGSFLATLSIRSMSRLSLQSSSSRDNLPQHENGQPAEDVESGWRATWRNNKGMFLILLAEVVGSSMDAIVRFLQQGGHSMHAFQVGSLLCRREDESPAASQPADRQP